MKSRRHPSFNDAFSHLSEQRQNQARKAFDQWKENPAAKGLGWHALKGTHAPLYSVHVGYRDRAVALVLPDASGEPCCTWLWIGSHEEYNVWIDVNKPRSTQTWTNTDAMQKMLARIDQRAAPEPARDQRPSPSRKSRHGR